MTGALGELLHADFVGSWSGSAPLTWGQRHIWDQIQRLTPDDHFLNNSYFFLLPDPSNDAWAEGQQPTPEAVVRAAAELLGMYEGLRTYVQVVDGRPRQIVAGEGRISLELVPSTADRADADAEAEQIRHYAIPFDYATDLPVRLSAVTVDGWVTHVVVCVSHLAVDGWAIRIVINQLKTLIVHGATQLRPGLQPVDLTRQQCGTTASDRALGYWGGAWRSIPPAMFTPAHPPAAVPFLRLRLESPALYGACRLIAARDRVSTSTVLLAATIGRVAAVTGYDTCAMVVHSGNRFRSALTTLVGTMSQRGVLVLDLRDRPTFDQLVRRSFLASLTAYRNAYYDQGAVDAVLAEVCKERGVEVYPHCCFNDARSVTARESTGEPPTRAEILAMRDDTLVTPTGEQPVRVDCRFCLELVDMPGYLAISLTADTSCLSPEEMAAFLRGMETDVVQAACC